MTNVLYEFCGGDDCLDVLRLGFRLINGWQVLKRGRRSHAMFVGSNIRISVGATLLLGNGFNDLGLDKIVVTT